MKSWTFQALYGKIQKNKEGRIKNKMKDLNNITKLLINVDMINGFVKKGAMADTYIAHIIPEQIKWMEQIKQEEEGIAFMKDMHKENCQEFAKFPAHCIEGTEESEVIKELKTFQKQALVYQKNSTSGIYAPNFIQDINKMINLGEVIIIGCCTDICILNLAIPLQNYFDQKDLDIKVTVPKNAVETYHSPNHNRQKYSEMAFELMKQAGINLI